ncbi:Arm DNA-binding domain-containing protein [Klebsiella pneumoniae]|nr:Arm DNA-binding domain-containing protein [Klebsiella pneumoniae]
MLADDRGLSARVSKTGTVSFVYFFRHSGRQSAPVWMTLGKYPDMTLKQAREKRDECRAWLSQGLWIGPYISIHFLSLNPLLVRRRRYSRGERYPSALCGCHSL